MSVGLLGCGSSADLLSISLPLTSPNVMTRTACRHGARRSDSYDAGCVVRALARRVNQAEQRCPRIPELSTSTGCSTATVGTAQAYVQPPASDDLDAVITLLREPYVPSR